MPVQFKHAELPNGLHILGEVDSGAHTAAIGFFVKTGARDEPTDIMGVSHFLEHMVFKGTAHRSAEEVDKDFDNIGADHNAYTTAEMTAYWAHCLPEHAPRCEEILADIMRPALRQGDFDDEKAVIIEEIAMYEDHPFWVLYERAMEAYYRSHPLAHRVLGTKDTISGMSRDAMMAYFAQRYSADNLSVAMAGRVDFDEMVGRLSEHCGSWATTRPAREQPALEMAASAFTHRSTKVNRHYTLMLCPMPALQDPHRYAASMLLEILGDSEGSRLYWSLVETGLAEEAQAQYEGRDGLGECLVYFSCSPENAEEVEAVARREMKRLIDSVTEDDLVRVRNKIATGATLQGERPAGRMRRLGQVWTYSREYRPLEEDLARIASVTLDDLRAVHEAFPIEPVVVARLAPE